MIPSDITSEFYYCCGNLYSAQDQSWFSALQKPAIYEVIRIIDGVPLFLTSHIQRLRNSARSMGLEINQTDLEIQREIEKLIFFNQERNINVKIVFGKGSSGEDCLLTYMMKSYYPSQDLYEKGIYTVLLQEEYDDPGIKKLDREFKVKSGKLIKETGAFEVLLVDSNGFITEGSRSSAFFVRDGAVVTAPSEKVLRGITRDKVMKVCSDLGIDILEHGIHMEEVPNLKASFLTGTSIDVLPISKIEESTLLSPSEQVVSAIREGYWNMALKDIEMRKGLLLQ